MDLIEKTKGSKLPIMTIEALKEEAEKICGKPEAVDLGERVIAAINWVDGTVIDVVRQVME
jgi:citrate lyase subunit alpha/citrate CoA-transferase